MRLILALGLMGGGAALAVGGMQVRASILETKEKEIKAKAEKDAEKYKAEGIVTADMQNISNCWTEMLPYYDNFSNQNDAMTAIGIDARCKSLYKAFVKKHGFKPKCVRVSNGTSSGAYSCEVPK